MKRQKGVFFLIRDPDLVFSTYSDYLFLNCFCKNFNFTIQINTQRLGFRDCFLVINSKNKNHMLIYTVKFARQRLPLARLQMYCAKPQDHAQYIECSAISDEYQV